VWSGFCLSARPLASVWLALNAIENDPRARAAYNEFLTLWKDADPNIPILKQAQAEYAKLK
jgi:hypothetical protein